MSVSGCALLVDRADHTGTDFKQFTIGPDLSTILEAPQFVARERELAEMHRLLYGRITHLAVVFHGLGGVGKTQLAIEFARKQGKSTAVFWLHAKDDGSLKLSFRDVAQQILSDHPLASMFASVTWKASSIGWSTQLGPGSASERIRAGL